jgi:hypothetical protein
VFKTIKVALCVAVLMGTASAGFAYDRHTHKGQVRAAQKSGRLSSFAQIPAGGQGHCWIPARAEWDGDNDDRGLGYWGSCGDKRAVPSR